MRLIASRIQVLLDNTYDLLDKLDLPPWQEYKEAASVAFHDVRIASVSSFKFGYLTFRPVGILLGIILQCLAVILQIILENSIFHGWRAIKEFAYQLQTATIWFIQYQRSLSRSAIYAEGAAMTAIITLWLLRRHVKKHRYYERTIAWYEVKKQEALTRYNRFVDQVGKTSTFLALLLPHLMYFILAAFIKRVCPWLITYLATKTPLNAFIQYLHPLYCTFLIIGKVTQHLRSYIVDEADENDNKVKKSNKKAPSNVKRQEKQKAELEQLRKEVVDILKYWVVYAIIIATVRTGKLLPFFGHLFTVVGDNVAKGKRKPILSKLSFTSKFVEEISLVFFTWLRFMPSSMTGQTKASSKGRGGNSPIDISYNKLSSWMKSAMNTSDTLANKAGSQGYLSRVVETLDGFLYGLKFARLISQETKQKIITSVTELSALLPAAITLFIPGFSRYGVIYVSLVVPAAYSIKSCDEIDKPVSNNNAQTMESSVNDASRFLRFWMIHALVTWILDSFAPILAWVPFSAHMTWLVWAFLLLETSTRKIYGWFESEVDSNGEQTMKLVNRGIAALPSNVGPHTGATNKDLVEKSKED